MRRHWLWAGAVLAIAVVVLLLRGRAMPQQSAFRSYFEQANQFEADQDWPMARAAWLFARHHGDTMYEQHLVEGNPAFYGKVISGARAYCDYRVAMTYEREGDYAHAAAGLEAVLATPVATINAYLGHNGAVEIAKDLSYVREVQSGDIKPCEGSVELR